MKGLINDDRDIILSMSAPRILIVEDDAILGAAVRDQVAADGHSVDWAMRLDQLYPCIALSDVVI
ncbi:MAG: hypothetical protein EOM52_13250, partial [Clostridia bacterium]|nr:hypothetical protein [Clostridia bacterium]